MTLLRSMQGTGFHVTTTTVDELTVAVTEVGGLDGAAYFEYSKASTHSATLLQNTELQDGP